MKPLYVETTIRCEMAELWWLTQDPACHARWDVRFTRIAYLPPENGRTRFTYATTVLPGLTVCGVGVTMGERTRPDGTCTSALRFRADHPLSMIKSGSGYWRYIPTGVGIRFLTGYDYRPGFALADHVFRPFFGWATAWSFDRLRLWAEYGVTPRRALLNALAEVLARAAVTIALSLVCPGWTVALAAAALIALPPGAHTPAARRCLRRPPDRVSRIAPSTLAALGPAEPTSGSEACQSPPRSIDTLELT